MRLKLRTGSTRFLLRVNKIQEIRREMDEELGSEHADEDEGWVEEGAFSLPLCPTVVVFEKDLVLILLIASSIQTRNITSTSTRKNTSTLIKNTSSSKEMETWPTRVSSRSDLVSRLVSLTDPSSLFSYQTRLNTNSRLNPNISRLLLSTTQLVSSPSLFHRRVPSRADSHLLPLLPSVQILLTKKPSLSKNPLTLNLNSLSLKVRLRLSLLLSSQPSLTFPLLSF